MRGIPNWLRGFQPHQTQNADGSSSRKFGYKTCSIYRQPTTIWASSWENLSSGYPTRSNTNQAVQLEAWNFWFREVEGLYYLSSENKGADQLCGYRTADLRLCFRICKKQVFSWCGSFKDVHGSTADLHQVLFSYNKLRCGGVRNLCLTNS